MKFLIWTIAVLIQVPCEQQSKFLYTPDTQPPPLAAAGVVVGDVNAVTAQSNRESIESGQQMPATGLTQFDRALTIKTGMTLNGGTGKNQYKTDQYPLNCTIQCYGAGVGYADNITWISATRWRIDDPNAVVNYQVGGVLYCFRYDGYNKQAFPDGLGQLCTRRTITAKVDNVITLSAGVDSRCNRAKWYTYGVPIIQDVRAGQLSVSLPSTALANTFAAGDYVMVTAGADVANADHCEFHRVVQVLNFSVQLDTPTMRYYRTPVLARYTPIHDVVIKNATFEKPINLDASTGFLKYATNVRIENVTFNGGLALGSSSHIALYNCVVNGEVGLNSVHDISFIGCRVSRLAVEESSFNVVASGCTFGPHEVPLQSSIGCERMTFTACTVTGGSNMPVSVGGPDMTFEDFAIENTTRSLYAYFSGDRLRVRWLRCDGNCEPVLYGGNGIVVQSIQARQTNLGWVDGSTSNGVALDCQNPVIKQGVWKP